MLLGNTGKTPERPQRADEITVVSPLCNGSTGCGVTVMSEPWGKMPVWVFFFDECGGGAGISSLSGDFQSVCRAEIHIYSSAANSQEKE